MSRLNTTASIVSALALTAAAVGCGGNKQPAYGSSMSSPSMSAMSPDAATPMIPTVPAGAQLLSQGTYNQIQFQVPSSSGLLYVFDHTTNSVVGTTNSVATNAGRPMTMADLKNTAQGLSMTDQYQIYFAPAQSTTRPMGGM